MADPPYEEIDALLREGSVVPFLGAGVNHAMRPPDAVWDHKESLFPPDGRELSRFLARRVGFPSDKEHDLGDLSKVASYFVDRVARTNLKKRLREIFAKEFVASDIHGYLAELSRDTPLLIVTTNYDDLTERAFDGLGLAYDLVVHPADRKDLKASVLWWKYGSSEPIPKPPNQLPIDLKTTTVIYKMHGTMSRFLSQWDNYVITEEDYVDFLSQMMNNGAVPPKFMRHFQERHFLFLGYGLQDWNLRVMLRELQRGRLSDQGANNSGSAAGNEEDAESQGEMDEREGKPWVKEELPSWAIQLNPSELEEKLWAKREVQIYDVDIGLFVKKLRGC